jgi:hypothetical protein
MAKTLKIRFLRNKAYNGTDYGPSYPEQIAEVDERFAYRFLMTGAAVVHEDEFTPPAGPLTTATGPVVVEDRAADADHLDPAPRRGKRGGR